MTLTVQTRDPMMQTIQSNLIRKYCAVFPAHVAQNRVFNEMMLTEMQDLLDVDAIDAFVAQYPYVRISSHGMQELVVYSRRHAIAKHVTDAGLASHSAMLVYRKQSFVRP